MRRILISLFAALTLLALSGSSMQAACQEWVITPSPITANSVITVIARGCVTGATYTAELQKSGGQTVTLPLAPLSAQNQYSATFGPLTGGQYAALLRENGTIANQITFTITANPGQPGGPCNPQLGVGCPAGYQCTNQVCVANSGGTTPNNTAEDVRGSCAQSEIQTAIGCIPYSDTNAIAGFFLRWALGIAGGVALTMIGFAAYRIMTSQGDPRRLQGGQELLLSAIGGLLMVVLSIYLLRFIGVDLLGIF